jgi:hypothetical protein
MVHRQEHLAFHFGIENNAAAAVGTNHVFLRNTSEWGLQFPVPAGQYVKIESECRISRPELLDDGFRWSEISNVKMHSGIKTEGLHLAFQARSFCHFNASPQVPYDYRTHSSVEMTTTDSDIAQVITYCNFSDIISKDF